jgi:uncharacterized membrane protein
MTLIDHLTLLTLGDGLAAAFILMAWAIVGWVIEHPPAGRPSVSTLMVSYRMDWMQAFEARDNRIFDAQIMGTLRQGTSFFASTSILAIGGVLALIGNTDQLRGVAQEFANADAPEFIWQLKLVLVGFFLTFAFLKFVWAHRLFGYCAVVMGAVGRAGEERGARLWKQAAELNIRASVNFTRGLRAMYFALGALGWLVGPIALAVTTIGITYLLWSREFSSAPREILLEKNGD